MGLEEAALVIEGAESNDRLGTANRQCVVDFNGDNDADLMVTSRSARSATGEPVGGVYFCDDPFQHLGRCGGEAGPRCSIDQLGVQILGDEPHQQFASGISKAGDVDGDGYEDVLVRAQTASHQGENSGSIYVLYGNANVREGAVAPAGPAPTTRIDGREAEHYFGQTATGIGDPDGDRIHDILIGARGPDGEEEAASYLFCGPIEQGVYGMLPDEALAVIPEVGDGTYPDSGSFPAVGGDLNGDSVDDFVLPVPNEDSERGGAYVFFGSSP